MDIGPVDCRGMAPTAISEMELWAWQQNRGRKLAPWECEFIMRLSREWAAQAAISENPDCPPPWADEPITDEERRAVADSLRDSM